MENTNRIKAVLVEQGKTGKWLGKQLKKAPATISKWSTNTSQPSIETLAEIACILKVNICELLIPTGNQKIVMIVL